MQDGKVSVLDIRAKMNDGTQVNIEVQVLQRPGHGPPFPLLLGKKLYGSELREGEPYDKLMPAISINLMDFNAFAQYTACHHSYHICNDETKDILIDDLEMHFIELEKNSASATSASCGNQSAGSPIFPTNAATKNGRCWL